MAPTVEVFAPLNQHNELREHLVAALKAIVFAAATPPSNAPLSTSASTPPASAEVQVGGTP